MSLSALLSLRRRPALAALLVFALALPALAVLKARSAPHYSLSAAQAIRAARADPRVAHVLAHRRYTSVRVSPVDDKEQRVSYLDGPRLVLHAAVGPGPQVTHVAIRTPGSPQSGSLIVNFPPFLIGATLLFLLATLRAPLRDLRNLDALAFASFVIPVQLLNSGLVVASFLFGYAAVGYLAVRFMAIGLRGPPSAPGSSLYWHLTRAWPRAQRVRVLKLVVAAMAVAATLVTITSTGPSDVAFAALAGATDLLHGVAPYGHIPAFIFHGDTYPLLTYAIYVPVAAFMPVTDLFSDPQGALLLTSAATLLVAGGLYRVAFRVAAGKRPTGAVQDREPPQVTGQRAALAWLAFPPVLLTASSGSNDVILALCVLAALGSLAHGRRSALMLAVAAWVKVVPVLALPIWLARLPRRAAVEAVAAILALSAALLTSLMAFGGTHSIGAMLHALAFQFERGSLSSLWIGMGLEWLQPAAEAALVAAVAWATLAVRRDHELSDDLPRLAAILTGLLLIAEFAASYWTWAYLPWAVVPALLVMVPARGRTRSSGRAHSVAH